MTYDALSEAVAEAERFLRRARALKKAHPQKFPDRPWVDGSPESSAVRRSSMDLTRALAKLRRFE